MGTSSLARVLAWLSTNYSQFFEQQCPDAYSYAYDDKSSTFTCSARPDYAITFCP
ncbi:hypothetical protein EI012_25510 [Escherichia coli]|nr:hypothetical protein [Escherichia coli]